MRLRSLATVGALGIAIVCLAVGSQPAEARSVVFEEVGQYADGGMAVTIVVAGQRIYLCEFDRGAMILDASDLQNIIRIGQLPGTAQARGIALVDGIAYVCCNVNGLKLFDVCDPSAPIALGSYGERNGDPHEFVPVGPVGYLTEWHGGLDIVDLSDPAAPRRLGEYRGGGHAFSVEIVGRLAFVTAYGGGLVILDVSDPTRPVLLGSQSNGGETNALHVVGTTAYVADKNQGLEIVDVSDPTSPALLGTWAAPIGTAGVRVAGDIAFVIHWERGLVAVDVRDPAHPVEVGSVFDGGQPNGLWVQGDLIYVADGTDGVEVFRFQVQE
jgi:hypothetical protein